MTKTLNAKSALMAQYDALPMLSTFVLCRISMLPNKQVKDYALNGSAAHFHSVMTRWCARHNAIYTNLRDGVFILFNNLQVSPTADVLPLVHSVVVHGLTCSFYAFEPSDIMDGCYKAKDFCK